MSPKFDCRAPNGKTYRIQYGVKAHTSVAASRLLWGLGFVAVISTPVKVRCYGCSSDPNLLGQYIADRSRILAMFAVAHFETADPRYSVEEWADVFISKAHPIEGELPASDSIEQQPLQPAFAFGILYP